LLLNGPFWVILFFIISGFVLPLSWFKSRRHSSIWGGVFRRYLRLMLPVLGILPLYYIVAQMDITTHDKTLKKVKVKNIWELFLDAIIGTWFGNNDYACVTWTLGVELWASFYVYLLAETVVFYRSRWVLYTAAILILFIPRITE
jgi:peptidoglycan/LPS O-acetylase OafA/YrhL